MAPPTTLSPRGFTRAKRVLLTPEEERHIERLVDRIAEHVGASLKLSHLLRACMELLRHVEAELIRGTHLKKEITEAVLQSVRWTAVITPYEFATKDLALFAKDYASSVSRELRFHPIEAATRSRSKPVFKAFLSETFAEHDLLAPTIYEQISVAPDATWAALLEAIKKSAPAQVRDKLVLKPVDAAGSRGVRPLDLKDTAQCERELKDLLLILRSMPVEAETARCDINHLLVEERLLGEEFSVESRRTAHTTEAIVSHWKVDIDGDESRFFERLFVTIPTEHAVASKLDSANRILLDKMGVGPGVFHAEYRLTPDLRRVHPLEVGLRPGGGMVNYSVRAARGIDLYESALQCAVGAEVEPVSKDAVVATGLVFANKADGGVLPPLRFHDNGKSVAVVKGDTDSLRERLQRLIETADRHAAQKDLDDVLSRDNALCTSVRSAFHDGGDVGLRATVDLVEVWMEPGELITEEEASYVAGLRIVADAELRAEAAMAEAVAAMRLCLASLKCEPESPLRTFSWRSSHVAQEWPQWWQDAKLSNFRSDIDSWTFSLSLQNLPADNLSVLDLGCGSARPAIPLIERQLPYTGIDVKASAVKAARGNIAMARAGAGCPIIEADVLTDNWIARLANDRWDVIAANLPYLACPPNELDPEVDGGPDGLRFVPDRVLDLAERFKAEMILINISTLSDLTSFADRIARRGYGVSRVIATLAPLEEYARRALPHLRRQSFVRIFGAGDDLRQIIYAFTLVRQRGISVSTTIRQIDRILKPNLNALYTIVDGVALW